MWQVFTINFTQYAVCRQHRDRNVNVTTDYCDVTSPYV